VNETVIGVGQVNSMNTSELREIKAMVLPHMEEARKKNSLDMIFFMLTDIVTESTRLLCCGPEALSKVIMAYDLNEDTEDIILRGVVSRKKQLVPTLVGALQQ
jgi:manganese-dependent inorganic pyrophosphatase